MTRRLSIVSGVVLTLLGAFFFFVPTPQATRSTAGSAPARATASVRLPMQAPAEADETPVYGYKIINTYPHDPRAFTQGLIYDNGFFYEGTGLNGRSSLRKVELETGKVLRIRPLSSDYFGEGIVLWKDELIQLTWQSHVGFIYDKRRFDEGILDPLLGRFVYPTEGWGITHDDKRLIMSDGTSTIYFLDPETFERIGRMEVLDNGVPVDRLNELEYIKGEIYANRWLTDWIYRISPKTGQVLGRIDLTGLLSDEDRQQGADVLNGIAYDAEHDRLFVTGKLWPKLFEIELVAK